MPCPNNIHHKISLQFTLKHTQDTISVWCIYKHIKAGRVWLEFKIQLVSAHKRSFGFKCGSFCIVLRCSQIVPVHKSVGRNGSTTWNDLTSNFVFEMARLNFHISHDTLPCSFTPHYVHVHTCTWLQGAWSSIKTSMEIGINHPRGRNKAY